MNGPDFYHSERIRLARQAFSWRECLMVAALLLVTLVAIGSGALQ